MDWEKPSLFAKMNLIDALTLQICKYDFSIILCILFLFDIDEFYKFSH